MPGQKLSEIVVYLLVPFFYLVLNVWYEATYQSPRVAGFPSSLLFDYGVFCLEIPDTARVLLFVAITLSP